MHHPQNQLNTKAKECTTVQLWVAVAASRFLHDWQGAHHLLMMGCAVAQRATRPVTDPTYAT